MLAAKITTKNEATVVKEEVKTPAKKRCGCGAKKK